MENMCEEWTGAACRPKSCVALRDLFEYLLGSIERCASSCSYKNLPCVDHEAPEHLPIRRRIPEADFNLANKTRERRYF